MNTADDIEQETQEDVSGAITPQVVRHEWETAKRQVGHLEDRVRAGGLSEELKRAWLAYLIEWKRAYATSLAPHTQPSLVAWRRAREYQRRTAAWARAIARLTGAHDAVSAGDELGELFITPWQIQSEMEAVAKGVKALDSQIAASRAPDNFKSSWSAFLRDWSQFYSSNKGFGSRLWGSTGTKVRRYARRLELWRMAYAQAITRTEGATTADVGAILVTPGAIKDELETVNSGVKQLDAEITASSIRPAFKKTWRVFKDEWAQFYKSKQGFWPRTWGLTMTKVLEYKKRVDEWRSAFAREGGQPAGPNLNLPPKGKQGGDDGFPWLLVGGLVAGGAFLGLKVFR